MAHHDKQMTELQDVLYAMKLTYTERETDAAHSFQSHMDELKNKVCRPVKVPERDHKVHT